MPPPCLYSPVECAFAAEYGLLPILGLSGGCAATPGAAVPRAEMESRNDNDAP